MRYLILQKIPKYIGEHLPIVIALVVGLLYLGIGRIYYVTNDDVAFVQILSGTRGELYRDMTVYCNVFLCKGLVWLYDIWFGLNWFVVLQCMLTILCLWKINQFLLRRTTSLIFIAICLVLNVVVGRYHLFEFQYTHNASLYIVCGIFFFYDAVGTRKWCDYLVAGGLLLVGAWLRFDCLLSVLPLFCLWSIYVFFERQESLVRCMRKFMPLFLMLCVCIATEVLNRTFYFNSVWENYSELNIKRTRIVDNYSQYVEDYIRSEQLDEKEESEVRMLANWQIIDKNILNSKHLDGIIQYSKTRDHQALSELVTLCEKTLDSTVSMLRFLFSSCLGLFICCVWLVYLYLRKRDCSIDNKTACLHQNNLQTILFMVCVFVAGIILYGCLEYVLHRCIFRAYYGYWLFVLMATLFIVKEKLARYTRQPLQLYEFYFMWITVLLFVLPCLTQGFIQTLRYHYKFIPMVLKYQKQLKELRQDSEHIYLFIDGYPAAHNAYHPFVTPQFAVSGNCISLGGWDVPSPRSMVCRQKSGCEYPIRFILDNKANVIFCGNCPEYFKRYLETHYDVRVSAEQISSGQPLNSFRMFVVKSKL